MPKKGGLGRGLEALFNDNASLDEQSVQKIRISEIEPNRLQPRKEFDEQALQELSNSIALHGVLQPIVARYLTGGGYQIVAGERRWRAAKLAGLESVPVIVKDLDDHQAMEIALIENLQREDLNPVEEAEGYQSLVKTYQLSHEQVAERVGKSRSAVANSIRLLALPKSLLDLLRQGRISAGHGRALLSITDLDIRQQALDKVLSGASVRDIENLAKEAKKKSGKAKPAAKEKNPYFSEVELALREELGRNILIHDKGKGKGVLEIHFFDQDDLTDLAYRLAGQKRNY